MVPVAAVAAASSARTAVECGSAARPSSGSGGTVSSHRTTVPSSWTTANLPSAAQPTSATGLRPSGGGGTVSTTRPRRTSHRSTAPISCAEGMASTRESGDQASVCARPPDADRASGRPSCQVRVSHTVTEAPGWSTAR